MRSWKTPTPEQVDRTIALLTHPEHQLRFFGGLQNPEWLGPLRKRGFFKRPPGKLGIPSYEVWPASRYLVHMAALAPDEVLNIVLEMEPTGNIRVHEDMIDAALAMPAPLAARLLTQGISRNFKWIESTGQLLLRLPDKLGALVIRLAEGGEGRVAWRLARAVLRIERELPDAVQPEEVEEQGGSPQAGLQIRMDKWDYERIVEQCAPVLVHAGGKQSPISLIALLRDTVQHTTDHGPAPHDYFYIPRPAIEDHPRNLPTGAVGPADPLLRAVRGMADSLIEQMGRHGWPHYGDILREA